MFNWINAIRSSLDTYVLSARTSGNATLYRLSLATRTALSARAHRKLPGENYEITPSSRSEHRARLSLTQMKLYLLRPLYIVTVYFHIFIAILFASSLAWACRDKLSWACRYISRFEEMIMPKRTRQKLLLQRSAWI